jgi:O-antigen/teichoic acid export membrane protein
VAVVGLVVTSAAAVALVPRFGGSGAAVASSVGYVGGAVLTWVFFARLARMRLRAAL